MRKIVVLIMMLLVVSAVSAQVPEEPTEPDFEYPDEKFGEPDTFINEVGDFFQNIFGGQQFAFTSESNVVEGGNYDWYDSSTVYSSPSTAVACQQCGSGDYCYVYHAGTWQGAEWQRTFADVWLKEYSTDNVDFRDYSFIQGWDFDHFVGYYCYEPPELTEYVYSCRDDGGNVDVYEDGSRVYSVAVAFCKITTKIVEGEPLTPSQIDSTFVDRADVCYTCSGGNLLTEVQDGCERGWSTSRPSSCDTTVECFKCDSQDGIVRDTFTNYCGAGYEENEPTCVKCYTCDGMDVIDKYDERCTGDWSRSVPDCEPDEPERVTCYQCQDGQIAEETYEQAACPSGWSTTEPNICQTTCYACSDGAVISDTFAGSCPEGYAPTQPASCDPGVVNKECYKCADGNTGVVLKELAPTCQSGWTANELTKSDCSGERNDIFAWFQDEAPQSYIIVISAVLIFGALIATISGRRPKKGVSI